METVRKGRWITRFSITASTILVGILFYWLLGFILSDISEYGRPDYQQLSEEYVSQMLKDQEQQLQEQLRKSADHIQALTENQQYIKSNADNLKTTINQMLELEKSRLQKNLPVSEKDKETLNQSQALFLEYQAKYQSINTDLLSAQQQKQAQLQELQNIQKELRQQLNLADDKFTIVFKKYNVKQASIQVTFLFLLFLFSLFLHRKYSGTKYQNILDAFTVAIVVKTGFTIHEHFPTRYFKYILVTALILFVIYLIIKLIDSIKSPKIEALIKQYREAYERFFCPKCDFPIQSGPRKFLFWTRRTISNVKLPIVKDIFQFETYHCPACGTMVYDECPSCQKTRHTLLSHCLHCGKEN